MKRISLVLLLLVTMVLSFTSCNIQPDFKFDVKVMGDVFDEKTNITAILDNTVYNTAEDVIRLSNAAKSESIKDATPEVVTTVDEIAEDIISEMPEGAIYEIVIKGFVKEMSTGLMFAVDKTFTNKVK